MCMHHIYCTHPIDTDEVKIVTYCSVYAYMQFMLVRRYESWHGIYCVHVAAIDQVAITASCCVYARTVFIQLLLPLASRESSS